MASVIWESLVSLRRCSREDFADNRSAQYLFIYIDFVSANYICIAIVFITKDAILKKSL